MNRGAAQLASVLLVVIAWPSWSPAQAQRAPEGSEAAPEGADDGEPEATPEDPKAAREAREHFQRGLVHFRERAFRAAIREFELAAQAVPSADLWFNIARAHEELSEYPRAVEHYRRYLRDRVDPPDEDEVKAHIAGLEERIRAQRESSREQPSTGTLRVRSSVDGARVSVDGREVGEAPVSVPLNLSPGAHELAVTKQGYIPFRSRVTVEAGVTTGAYAELAPQTGYRAITGGRVWTWVAGGLAVGALGASLGLGIRARKLQSDDMLADARDWATYSDYALVSGIGLGVVAAILWFIEGRAVATERVSGPVAAAR